MLGPVMICMRCVGPNKVSLAMKLPPVSASLDSTTGWRPCVMLMPGVFTSSGAHQLSVRARSLKVAKTSKVAKPQATWVRAGTKACKLSSSCS